jgi:hypothetical protein
MLIIIEYFKVSCKSFLFKFSTNLGGISYNVPAVYEGFYGAIKETEGFQRHKNFGWSGAWEPLGDLAERNPEGL